MKTPTLDTNEIESGPLFTKRIDTDDEDSNTEVSDESAYDFTWEDIRSYEIDPPTKTIILDFDEALVISVSDQEFQQMWKPECMYPFSNECLKQFSESNVPAYFYKDMMLLYRPEWKILLNKAVQDGYSLAVVTHGDYPRLMIEILFEVEFGIAADVVQKLVYTNILIEDFWDYRIYARENYDIPIEKTLTEKCYKIAFLREQKLIADTFKFVDDSRDNLSSVEKFVKTAHPLFHSCQLYQASHMLYVNGKYYHTVDTFLAGEYSRNPYVFHEFLMQLADEFDLQGDSEFQKTVSYQLWIKENKPKLSLVRSVLSKNTGSQKSNQFLHAPTPVRPSPLDQGISITNLSFLVELNASCSKDLQNGHDESQEKRCEFN